MADDVVIIDIVVEDNSSTDISNITNNVVHLHQAVQREERQENKWQASLKRISKASLTAARAVAKVAASVLAVAAATGPATAGLLAAGKAVATFGKAALHLTPLLAFLPSLIGAFKLIQTTVKLMGPGLARAFEPFLLNFRDAKGEASAFTKRLQDIAGIGLKPLVGAFNKVNLPAIQRGMEGIAYQINGIVNHTLRWLNTATGQSLISKITLGTVKAFENLTPHILRLVYAFGGLAEKAGDRAILGLGDVIGRLLDKISAWAETHDLDDINAALKDLGGYGGKLKDTFTVVRDIGRWMAENRDKVKAFSDAVAVGAVAIGIATGNIPAVIGGAFALIVNHWADLKAQFTGAGPWLSDLITRWKQDAGRIKLAESITNALRGFKETFLNVIKGIGPKWTEFIRQVKAAWEQWAPLITAWWNTGGKQAFEAAGAALGLFVLWMLDAATKTAAVATSIAEAFKTMVRAVLDVLGFLISGAAKAFSWVPGLGPKLAAAAAEFEAFKNSVNRALAGIDPIKTVRINASVYVTGGGSVAGGVDQRTGNSHNSGLGAMTSWMHAAAEVFAASTGGNGRTGGPTQLTASVSNTVLLDGRPFRQYTDRKVELTEQRTAWRGKTGRR